MRDHYEFLEKLRQNLNGRVDGTTLQETIDYYQEYFEVQMRNGKTEQEVLDQLGDPRLLAKTIYQAQEHMGMPGDAKEEEQQKAANMTFRFGQRVFSMPKWLGMVLMGAAIFLVIGLLLSALWYLLPIILIISTIVLLYRFIRDLLS